MTATRRQVSLQLNVEKDAAIIAYLDAQPNRTEAIRRAIRSQMEEDDLTQTGWRDEKEA